MTLLVARLLAALVIASPAASVAARPDQQPSSSPAADAASSTMREVLEAIDRNDPGAATRALDPALRARPGDPVLQNLAGVVAAQRGESTTAERHFREAIRLAPQVASPYLNLARLYQEAAGGDPGAIRKALDVYRALLGHEPRNAEALYQSAFLLVVSGDTAAARPLVARLPADVARTPQVLLLRALTLADSGDQAGANNVADALARHPDFADADVAPLLPALTRGSAPAVGLPLLEALDRRGGASPLSLRQLGILQLRAGRPSEARRTLERAAAVSTVDVPLLLDLARAAHAEHDHKGALGYLARARDIDPSQAVVHFFFGIVCIDLNLGAEAYESIKRALALDPENPYVNYALGAVAIHRHEPSESLPYFEKYATLRPDDPRGRFALGAAYFYSKLFDQARPLLRDATRHAATAAGAHFFLGRIARQLNDLEEAERELGQALAAQPRHAEAWAELGLVQMRRDRPAEAEASLLKAQAIEPDNYAATLNLATLYKRTRDPRAEAQAARLAAAQGEREARAQEFLRLVEVVP